jgi:hypothetical protein
VAKPWLSSHLTVEIHFWKMKRRDQLESIHWYDAMQLYFPTGLASAEDPGDAAIFRGNYQEAMMQKDSQENLL